jgi:hypothetical protein
MSRLARLARDRLRWDQTVPDQDYRPAELLVRVVQQPGVVRLGEPFALVPGTAAAGVNPVAMSVATRC